MPVDYLERRRVVVPRHGAELVRIDCGPGKSVLAGGFGPVQHQVVPVDGSHHEHRSSPVDVTEAVQLGVPEEGGALLAVGWNPRDAYGVGHLLAVYLHILEVQSQSLFRMREVQHTVKYTLDTLWPTESV